MLRRCVGYAILATLICACNLRRPEVTLTLVPIETRTPQATDIVELPTETPVVLEAPSWTPTATRTHSPVPSPTEAALPTEDQTATLTSTVIATPSPTETTDPTSTVTALLTSSPTRQASATPTSIPAATETGLPTLTSTDLPTPTRILPRTLTPTVTASSTPEAKVTASETAPPEQVIQYVETAVASPTESVPESDPPTFTPLPTFDATEMAKLLATSTARPTDLATWTAVPSLQPTVLAVAVRDSATPARATATQGPNESRRDTSLPSTALPQLGAATLTPTFTPTRFQPTVAVREELIVEEIDPPVFQTTGFNTIGASVYQYEVNQGQVFAFQGLQLAGGVVLFAPNPASADSFLRTDQAGMLFYRAIGSASESQMSYSPFFRGFQANSSATNENLVVEIDWSADGRQFTFRIDTPAGQDSANAGVWLWQPEVAKPTDPTYGLIRDCVTAGYHTCQMVNPSNAWYWKTVDVQWSPVAGRNDILLTVELPDENRQALAMVQAVRDAGYANNAPPFTRYDYGHWNTNGNGIVISGRRPDGRVIIGQVNNQFGGEQVLFDASAAGLWMQDAVRRPNGQIVALGRPGGPYDNRPVGLYNVYGQAITGPIGGAAPDDVQWYPDRSAVVISVGDRQYTANVNSGYVIDTTDLTRNPSFGSGPLGAAPLPAGVIRGSEYFPGQQLRAVQNLNVRQGPSTSTQIVGGLFSGDYVAVIAGPHEAEGYRWWRVQTANNILGWIAGTIGGRATIAPG